MPPVLSRERAVCVCDGHLPPCGKGPHSALSAFSDTFWQVSFFRDIDWTRSQTVACQLANCRASWTTLFLEPAERIWCVAVQLCAFTVSSQNQTRNHLWRIYSILFNIWSKEGSFVDQTHPQPSLSVNFLSPTTNIHRKNTVGISQWPAVSQRKLKNNDG